MWVLLGLSRRQERGTNHLVSWLHFGQINHFSILIWLRLWVWASSSASNLQTLVDFYHLLICNIYWYTSPWCPGIGRLAGLVPLSSFLSLYRGVVQDAKTLLGEHLTLQRIYKGGVNCSSENLAVWSQLLLNSFRLSISHLWKETSKIHAL